jgi:hypothetical protein
MKGKQVLYRPGSENTNAKRLCYKVYRGELYQIAQQTTPVQFPAPFFITSGAGWKCMRPSGEVGGAERKILPRARNENPILIPVNT